MCWQHKQQRSHAHNQVYTSECGERREGVVKVSKQSRVVGYTKLLPFKLVCCRFALVMCFAFRPHHSHASPFSLSFLSFFAILNSLYYFSTLAKYNRKLLKNELCSNTVGKKITQEMNGAKCFRSLTRWPCIC